MTLLRCGWLGAVGWFVAGAPARAQDASESPSPVDVHDAAAAPPVSAPIASETSAPPPAPAPAPAEPVTPSATDPGALASTFPDLVSPLSPPDAVAPGVAVRVGGFADVTLEGGAHLEKVDFQVGQLVGHATAAMPGNFSVFTEVTFNSSPTWETRVERLLLSWERGDFLKLSLGRHHLPVTWWNSTFHHGLWLQTSARRPLMIGYSDAFIPNHAVGLVAEGFVPGARRAGLRYHAAFSGGGDDHRHSVETADEPPRFAVTGALFYEPPAIPRLRLGAVMYADPHRMRSGVLVSEQLVGAHLAYTRERPELVAEYVAVLHHAHPMGTAPEHHQSDAAYAQLGWRFRGAGERLKPYLRVEQMRIDADDPTLADRASQRLGTVGLRADVSTHFAVKAEGALRAMDREEPAAEARLQVSASW